MMQAKHSAILLRANGCCRQILRTLSGQWQQCYKLHRPDILARHIHANRCSSKTLSQLNSRAVVRLSGSDTLELLQGLVTSDVHQLSAEGVSAQYSMMLNVQGRVLYDLFLYNISEDLAHPILLIDVDSSAKEDLIKIFKMYRLRKKVDVSDVTDEFQVWSKFKINTDMNIRQPEKPATDDIVIVTLDPRVPGFGKRIIRKGQDDEWIRNSVDESVYRQMRYQWGIPEGPVDLPTGNCFPLESNLAFMNGVSFEKGCYIGQELTARTHHTGVIRKRLMPVSLNSPPLTLEKDATIVTEKGRNAGKIRSHEEGYGLGLIRLAYLNDNLSVTSGDVVLQVKTHLPDWWPPLDSSQH